MWPKTLWPGLHADKLGHVNQKVPSAEELNGKAGNIVFDRDLLVGNKEVPINVEDESAHDDEEPQTNVEPEQPIPQDWNTYQNGPTGEDIFPGNRLERTKKIPGKDYMVLTR